MSGTAAAVAVAAVMESEATTSRRPDWLTTMPSRQAHYSTTLRNALCRVNENENEMIGTGLIMNGNDIIGGLS